MKRGWLVTLGLLLISLPAAMAAPTLKVGDPAPPLKVAKWFKGQPVEKFEPNSIYVVEFWATWCGPCKKNIPHLTELAKKFEGKARIIGVSIWESEKTDHDKRLAKVGSFVEQMGAQMDYLVAADDNDGSMGKNWMEAAEETGIPTAFIVGKDGKIAWIGYPWEMDQKLQQTVDGTLNLKAVQADAAKKQEEKDAKAKVDALFAPVMELKAQAKAVEALAALDKIDAEHPELADRSGFVRYRVLLGHDDAAASRQALMLARGPLNDNASALYMMTRDLTEPASRTTVDWDVPVALASRAVELSKDKPVNYLIVLAHAYFRKGDLTKALETARQAEAKAEADPEFDKHTLSHLKGRIRQYEQKQASPQPAPGK